MDSERLVRVKTLLDAAISNHLRQEERLKEIRNEYNDYVAQAELFKDTANYVVNLLKRIRQHEDDKKMAAYSLIEDSLSQISSIIPSSQMANVGLKVENNKVYVINKETGQTIKMVEGGAVNSIVCLLMRYIVTTNNIDFTNFLYIDEGLSTVGHDNIMALKVLLKEISKNCLIIITEQKHDVTEGVADLVFNFHKPSDDAPTVITKEEVNQ